MKGLNQEGWAGPWHTSPLGTNVSTGPGAHAHSRLPPSPGSHTFTQHHIISAPTFWAHRHTLPPSPTLPASLGRSGDPERQEATAGSSSQTGWPQLTAVCGHPGKPTALASELRKDRTREEGTQWICSRTLRSSPGHFWATLNDRKSSRGVTESPHSHLCPHSRVLLSGIPESVSC